jgi:eukaryotic-like serine/threonine-protein kinase
MIGTTLGVYRITAALGAGGMGEVYQATDTRLGREVAIKLLSDPFKADAERLARFEREARLLASLNHPNVAAIHGVEDSGGLLALVLELVDGQTLAERLVAGPLPVKDALAIARQIAEALDAAHERGIVHRDLKPANIKVTREGIVKVLDFGVAKAVGSRVEAAEGATLALDGTSHGVLIGTVAYMSPEQARGMDVDKRSDIWAFGCVLFEMLAGRSAFGGASTLESIAGILERDPEWTRLPDTVPAVVRRLLGRCLEKDPRRRLRDIGDAWHELDAASSDASARPQAARPRRSLEFQRLTDQLGLHESPAMSPDGKMVAFVAMTNGRRQIWIRLLAGGAPLQVTRDDADHDAPRWSPDSSTLIYFTPSDTPGEEGTLCEVSALGGLSRPMVSALGGGDVSHDGRRIALMRFHGDHVALMTIDRAGDDARPVAVVPRGHAWMSPRWSPDDTCIAYHGRGLSVWDERLHIVPADGGESRTIAHASNLRGVSGPATIAIHKRPRPDPTCYISPRT